MRRQERIDKLPPLYYCSATIVRIHEQEE
jgi:hypothetical protein